MELYRPGRTRESRITVVGFSGVAVPPRHTFFIRVLSIPVFFFCQNAAFLLTSARQRGKEARPDCTARTATQAENSTIRGLLEDQQNEWDDYVSEQQNCDSMSDPGITSL